jgi:hypothetical protein
LIVANIEHILPDDFMKVAESIARRYMLQGKNILDNEVSQKAFIELFDNLEERLDKPRDGVPLLERIKRCGMEIPFEDISRIFRIIETGTESVIIPYNDEALQLITELRQELAQPLDDTSRNLIRITRSLQQYAVQTYSNDLERIESSVERISRVIDDECVAEYRVLIDRSRYSPDVGLLVYTAKQLEEYHIRS